jgi:aspartate oxidase
VTVGGRDTSWSFAPPRPVLGRQLLPIDSGGIAGDRAISQAGLPELMWRSAGLVRDGQGLRQALDRIGDGSASPQHRAARLLCEAALLRQESRGAHYRQDHPVTSDRWLGHIVQQVDRGSEFELA